MTRRKAEPRQARGQMILPALLTPARHQPSAARAQQSATDWDTTLVDMARRNHPLVAWWFGMRRTDEGHGAYCYVCDTMIITCAPASQISRRARAAIDAHRTEHWPAARAYRRRAK